MLFKAINHNLNELIDLLLLLTNEEYTHKNNQLSNATIGEHTRHVVEMYFCLITNYEHGIVNYELRERNKAIENYTKIAIEKLNIIKTTLQKENKNFYLTQEINGLEIKVETNYFRELIYNLEHTIHHQALIKVALKSIKRINICNNFGVAPSTISYRTKCAQ